tara:strand:+ start:87 stop:398 length:312 start_codon:yes stop_codon:yes gene_type:complete
MSDKVKNREVEQETVPVIKYRNTKGEDIEIPESDLNEAETNILNKLNEVKQKLQEIDEAHINTLTRQSLVMNEELLSDDLRIELLRFDDETPEIITETKQVKS